jgi:cytochrome c oxidase subunit II
MKPKMALPFALIAMLVVALLLIQSAPAQQTPRRIEVTAKRFDFTPGDITLKKGEPVVLVLKSVDVTHGIRFKELGIETKAAKGQTIELAFTPDKTGTFVGHCSVFCGSGHGAMTFTLRVVD